MAVPVTLQEEEAAEFVIIILCSKVVHYHTTTALQPSGREGGERERERERERRKRSMRGSRDRTDAILSKRGHLLWDRPSPERKSTNTRHVCTS